MTETAKYVPTLELWARLFQAPTVDRYLADNAEACKPPAFSDYIGRLCQSRDEKPEWVINRSGIERSYGHRLFSGTRNPSRDTVLQLAFGFDLTTDETQQLLKVARATPLHPKVKRDAIIAFCLHNHLSIMEAQQTLFENGQPIMGGKKMAQQMERHSGESELAKQGPARE